MNAAVLVFDDVEVLDFCGPFEVFASTREPGPKERHDRPPAFATYLVAARGDIVRCRGGMLVRPNFTFADCPPPDVLVAPGGFGVLAAQEHGPTVEWIKAVSKTAKATTSVCTGAFLLARAGLLDGKPATTHWAEIAAMREQYPAVHVHDDYRVVDLGKVITSAGVSAGIDMTLHLIERLLGRDAALDTARGIEYRWEPVPTLVWS